MTIVVEDGTGLSNAESYCSTDFADAFLGARGYFVWTNATGTTKEVGLRRATDYMLQMYRGRWLGMRTVNTQALDWPRTGVELTDVNAWFSNNGFSGNVMPNVVPLQVQQACALLATRVIQRDASGAFVDLAPDVQRQTRSEKVGPIEVTYEPGSIPYVRYRSIDHLLGPYFATGLTGVPLSRA